jgi:tetratricopeptide (TPR) repeat protein
VTNRLFAVDTFALSLHSRWRAVLFLLALALGGAAVSRVAIRTALAARLSESLVLSDLRRALALDPDNPAIYNRLGISSSFLPDLSASSEGPEHLRQAVRLNPDETLYWLNLASNCELAGDYACADEAFGHALALSPMVPRVQWMAANYYLRTDRPAEARARFRRVLAMGPWYVVPTLHTCFRSFPDPEILVREVLPEGRDPAPRLALLNLLSSQGEVDAAYQVWVLAMKDAPPRAFADVRPFLDTLIRSGGPSRAWMVWQDLIRAGVVRRPAPGNPANLVFNGDFEQAPLNGGFDWAFRDEPYLELDAQSRGALDGGRCLRVDFTVSHNDEHEPVSQYVPVAPQRTYALTAYVRAEGITSDSGPRLRVLDAVCPRCLEVATEPVVGTRDWGPVSLTFTTGSESHFVRLSVWRPRGRTFPMDISGRFWLDKVVLVPAPERTANSALAAPAAPH